MKLHKYVKAHFDYYYNTLNCDCDYICRCGTIENVEFEEAYISEYYLNQDFKSVIDRYCVERILSKKLIQKPHLFGVSIRVGYYGEEIDGWTHDNEDEVKELIHEIERLDSNVDKILTVLDMEYGFIPEHIKNIENVGVIELDVDEVRESNFNKLIRKQDYTQDYIDGLPIGIINQQLNIIDGNHRIMNYPDDKAKFIEIS